jgi:hypothetical protein
VIAALIFLAIAVAAAPSDPSLLSDDCVALFASGFTDETEDPATICPDENGHVPLRKGGTSEANGVPDEVLKDLTDDAMFARNRDIFDDEQFRRAAAAINRKRPRSDRGDEILLAIRTVFERATWKWEPFEPKHVQNFTIYACTDLDALRASRGPAAIHLYTPMCTAYEIYATSLGRLDARSRFILVATHELGHIVDALAGPAVRPAADAEMAATIYGTYFARFMTRQWAELYCIFADSPDDNHPEMEAERQKNLNCLNQRQYEVERQLSLIGHPRRVLHGRVDPALRAAFACAAGDGGSTARVPVLKTCPVR